MCGWRMGADEGMVQVVSSDSYSWVNRGREPFFPSPVGNKAGTTVWYLALPSVFPSQGAIL